MPHNPSVLLTVLARFRVEHSNSPPNDPPQGPFLEFLEATTRAGAIRTLESLARIEAGAQGGALVECTTTTRTAKNGTTTTVRERYTRPDWRAAGWFLGAAASGGLVSAHRAGYARPRAGCGGGPAGGSP